MFQEDSNNQTVNILASVSFFLKMDPFRQWHQRRFCCKFLLTGLITLNSWQNLANVDVMVTQEARLCNTYEECENLTFGSGKHVLGCFVPMMWCLSRKITRSWKIVYSLKQTRCDCQDGGYLSLCGMFKVLEALWHSKSMHPCIPRWCKHCGMYKGGKHCGVAGPCRCRGCHCRLCGISMVRACTIHGSDLEPSRNSSFVNKLSWFWKHTQRAHQLKKIAFSGRSLVIYRDLSWSHAVTCQSLSVCGSFERGSVCVCVWLVWVWEAGRTQGRNRKDAWKWTWLSAPYNRLLLWFRGSEHRKISKRKRAFLILVIVHGLSSMVPLYENRVFRVKFIYFCLIISFRLFSKLRVSISLP